MKPFALAILCAATVQAADPIVIADFEGNDYGGWEVSGTAFGTGPAKGALPHQQAVSGFRGKGLVNSYAGGDDSTGRLLSPPFRIERAYLTFLIGGGGYAGETCMNLVVDGKPARTASGPNTEPGGAESLEAAAWDVRDFQGREARVEIVDKRKGGWGHINVDHIVLADDLGNARIAAQPAVKQDLARRLKVDADFLQLPLLRGADGRRSSAKLSIENPEGKLLRYVHVDLASANQRPDSIYSYDLRELRGQ